MVLYTISYIAHPKRGSSWFSSFLPDKQGDFVRSYNMTISKSYTISHLLFMFSLPFNAVRYKVQATEYIVKNYSTDFTEVILLLLLS